MILFKKGARHKVKSYIYCVDQFLRQKRQKKKKNETENVNKNSRVCPIFVIFLIFSPL